MKSPAIRRGRHVRLAAAATLVVAGVGVIAGCAGQAVSASDASVTAPSTAHTTAQHLGRLDQPLPDDGREPRPRDGGEPHRHNGCAVEDCGQGKALTRPAELVLACADQELRAKHLTWSSWSATSVTATGLITWHVCTPSCAQSTKWDSSSAQITLIDPVPEPRSQILFTKLELRVTGPTPPGFARTEVYDMAPTN